MKTAICIIATTLCTVASVQAQWWGNGKKINGNGNMATKNRTVPGYDQVKVKGNLDVALVAGAEGKILIEAESNLIEYIVTEVEGEALKVYVKKGYYLKPSNGTKLLITVPFTDLTQVTLSGSGDVYSTDPIKATDFKTALSGSGDIELIIEANTVYAQLSGSGDMELEGNADNFTSSISGSGDLEAYDLNAKNATAMVSGSGDIQLTATSSLKARVSGSGDISYKGDPEKEDIKISGSGDVDKKS